MNQTTNDSPRESGDSFTSQTLLEGVELAYNYHGGQWSDLYSFASTGGYVHSRSHGFGLSCELGKALEIARESYPEDIDGLEELLTAVDNATGLFRDNEED